MISYSMDEVIAKAGYTWNQTMLADYPNIKQLPNMIVGNYGGWMGIWVEDGLTDAEIKAKCYSQCTLWNAWLIKKAEYWNDWFGRQKAIAGKTKTKGKFLDTPETEADYSGDSHITNVNVTETEGDNVAGMDRLRPVLETLVEEFRKTWLLPAEAFEGGM